MLQQSRLALRAKAAEALISYLKLEIDKLRRQIYASRCATERNDKLIAKRSLSRLIADGKIVARKEGSRTLVDVESLKAYYAGLPVNTVDVAKKKALALTAGQRVACQHQRLSFPY